MELDSDIINLILIFVFVCYLPLITYAICLNLLKQWCEYLCFKRYKLNSIESLSIERELECWSENIFDTSLPPNYGSI